MLFQLIYASTISHNKGQDTGQHDAQTASIVKQAARCNAARGISGVLLASPTHYLQVLEGSALEINALYNRITQDPRHQRVELLAYLPVLRRQYKAWAMTLIPFDEHVVQAEWAEHPDVVFSPYELDSADVHILVGKAQARMMLGT